MSRKTLSIATALTLTLVLALAVAVPAMGKAFTHAPVITVDGVDYYLAGAPDGPDGATDIPGHYWVQAGHNQLVGKHFNNRAIGDTA